MHKFPPTRSAINIRRRDNQCLDTLTMHGTMVNDKLFCDSLIKQSPPSEVWQTAKATVGSRKLAKVN